MMRQSDPCESFDNNQRLWYPFAARLLRRDSVVPATDALREECVP